MLRLSKTRTAVEIVAIEKSRIQADGGLELLFGFLVVLAEGCRETARGMGFGGFRGQLDGLAAGGDRFRQVVFAGIEPHVQKRAAIGHPGEGARIQRIDDDGTGEHLPGKFHALAAHLMKELAAAQVVVVRLNFAGGYSLDLPLFLFGEDDAQGPRNPLRDFIVNLEDVLELAVVTLGPDGMAGAGLGKLSGDAQTLAGAANAAS